MRYRDECMPLVSSVDIVYYDLRVAQLNNRNDLSSCSMCQKVIPCFLVHPPPMPYVRQKIVCVIEHQCVCALARTYTTCTSTNYVHVPELV